MASRLSRRGRTAKGTQKHRLKAISKNRGKEDTGNFEKVVPFHSGEQPNSLGNHNHLESQASLEHTRALDITRDEQQPNLHDFKENHQVIGKSYKSAYPVNGRMATAPIYGALDLGTNNCRLLLASPTRHSYRVRDSFSKIVRLGEGLGESGKLSDQAMDRAIDALKICQEKLASYEVNRFRLIATQACRFAGNGNIFIDRVKNETGLNIEIIDQETEAKLAVAGCSSLIDWDTSGTVVFDVGGGSSEIVWIDHSQVIEQNVKNTHKLISSWISLPIGVVTLSEKYRGKYAKHDDFEQMVAASIDHIHQFTAYQHIQHMAERKEVTLLGTSGTVTTIAGVFLNLKRYERRRIDGIWLNRGEVRRISQSILDMSYEERCSHPCIGVDRADLVISGCAIVEAMLRAWNIERIRVADRGLREGILLSLMAEDDAWASFQRPQRPKRLGQKKR